MSEQRDELAALIDREINELYSPGDDVMGEDLAVVILAAGYRKPRSISEGTRVSLVDSLLAYKGTPRHKLFEYPHRDDDSRAMIREAEAVVTAILAVLYGPTP